MEILTATDYDFNVWYNSYDPIFVDITAKSKVPDKWANYRRVLEGRFGSSVIKPINKYVEELYPAPKLLSIDGNTVTLRQYTHADIFLLERDGILKATDRPHIRQFYKSNKDQDICKDCFDDKFVMYVPWFIDANILVSIKGIPDSPFVIKDKTDRYQEIPEYAEHIEPMMVQFRFKRTGKHMENDVFGKIKRGTPSFDMTFIANDTIIERVRKFYEQD